jgi:homoserine kinase
VLSGAGPALLAVCVDEVAGVARAMEAALAAASMAGTARAFPADLNGALAREA